MVELPILLLSIKLKDRTVKYKKQMDVKLILKRWKKIVALDEPVSYKWLVISFQVFHIDPKRAKQKRNQFSSLERQWARIKERNYGRMESAGSERLVQSEPLGVASHNTVCLVHWARAMCVQSTWFCDGWTILVLLAKIKHIW